MNQGLPTANSKQGSSFTHETVPESAESNGGTVKGEDVLGIHSQILAQLFFCRSLVGYWMQGSSHSGSTSVMWAKHQGDQLDGVQEKGGLLASILRGSQVVSYYRSTTANSCCARQLSPGFTTAGFPNLAFSTQQNFL